MYKSSKTLLAVVFIGLTCLFSGSNGYSAEPTIIVRVVATCPLNVASSAIAPAVAKVSEYVPYAEVKTINPMTWDGSSYVGDARLVMSSSKPSYKIKAEVELKTVSGTVYQGIVYKDVPNPPTSLAFVKIEVDLQK